MGRPLFSDGCGGECSCTGGQTCGSNGRCQSGPGVYERCTEGASVLSQGDCNSSSLVCGKIEGMTAACYEVGGLFGCNGFQTFGDVCLVECTPGGANTCPRNTRCVENFQSGGANGHLGYCIFAD